MTQREKNANAVLVPLLAATAGALLAVLLVPRTGRETREGLQSKADSIESKAKDKYATARQTVESHVGKAKDLKKRFADKFGNTSEEAKLEAERLKAEAEASKEHLRSSILNNWEDEV